MRSRRAGSVLRRPIGADSPCPGDNETSNSQTSVDLCIAECEHNSINVVVCLTMSAGECDVKSTTSLRCNSSCTVRALVHGRDVLNLKRFGIFARNFSSGLLNFGRSESVRV
jgi:hypothetical protein